MQARSRPNVAIDLQALGRPDDAVLYAAHAEHATRSPGPDAEPLAEEAAELRRELEAALTKVPARSPDVASPLPSALGSLDVRDGRTKAGLILFVHGFGGSAAGTWQRFPELIRDDPELAEFDVSFFDYRPATGCGVHFGPFRGFSWSRTGFIPRSSTGTARTRGSCSWRTASEAWSRAGTWPIGRWRAPRHA